MCLNVLTEEEIGRRSVGEPVFFNAFSQSCNECNRNDSRTKYNFQCVIFSCCDANTHKRVRGSNNDKKLIMITTNWV